MVWPPKHFPGPQRGQQAAHVGGGVFHTINRVIHRHLWMKGLVTRSEGPMVSPPGHRAFGCADPDNYVSTPLGWTIRLTPDDFGRSRGKR